MNAEHELESSTRNPATGEVVGRAETTPASDVAGVVAKARRAQASWADTPWRTRRKILDRWRAILNRDAESWADLIRSEVGKPSVEAMAGDLLPTLDLIRWTTKNGRSLLQDERISPSWQRWLLFPAARLRWKPVGVVGMIGTWNYPLMLNAGPIAQALAAGCAVVWKPSELAIATGLKLQASLQEAGVPPGLVGMVIGGGEVGRALVEASIDKVVFTGSVGTGRRVLAAAAAQGIPAVAELSGFDPAVVLADAPLDSTVRSLVWSAFVGCGQTCVAVKRVYVVGDPQPWIDAFRSAVERLKVGDPAQPDVDVGPLIHEQARDRFDQTIQATVAAGAEVVAGGRPLELPGAFYSPTVLFARDSAPEQALEGAFGPVVLVRGVADVEEAVEACNSSSMALGASVWGNDRSVARSVARRIDAGMVCVNEAVAPTASASAPFGGVKASGFGRTHGLLGFREFVASQTLFERRTGGFRPQLFPYQTSSLLKAFLRVYRRLYHP